MTDAEAVPYEEHFFDCARCAALVSEQALIDAERAIALPPSSMRWRRRHFIARGSLAQAAALVSHGNAALGEDGTVPQDAWARLSPFVTANSVSIGQAEATKKVRDVSDKKEHQ
jgi:hypothetical protein